MTVTRYDHVYDLVRTWSGGDCKVCRSEPDGMILIQEKHPNGVFLPRRVTFDYLEKKYERVRDNYNTWTIIIVIGIAAIALAIILNLPAVKTFFER